MDLTLDGNWNTGDTDDDGHFWVSLYGKAWVKIDVDPRRSTYGTILARGTATSANNVADWAFVKGGGNYLYGLQSAMTTNSKTAVARFSLDTQKWETLQDLGFIAGTNTWGAVYAVGPMLIYASENTSGVIYRFNLATYEKSLVVQGPKTSQNDGARCINASPPGSGS
ncbi:hypothetical protein EDB82DRAFT_486248 [Fusarium venenatum]|nr:hypothetical protein EDB82DRAFT_486248 [Fusarium venenatum]